MTMRALLVLFLLLLVQSGLLAFVLVVASGGRLGDLAVQPGYVSGNIRAERTGSPARPTGIDPDRTPTSTAPPSR
jgi:hypothetical protein